MIYHIDISSSAGMAVNDILFKLLFLRFLKTPNSRCFSVTNNMAFFIEIPTDLASLQRKQNQNKVLIKDEFYLLHQPMKFATQRVNNNTNPFGMNEDAYYAATFAKYFYDGKLKTKVWFRSMFFVYTFDLNLRNIKYQL